MILSSRNSANGGLEGDVVEELRHAPHVPGDLENRPFHEADDEQAAVVQRLHLAFEVPVPLGRSQIGERIAFQLRKLREPAHGVFDMEEVPHGAGRDAHAPFAHFPARRDSTTAACRRDSTG